MYSSRCGVFSVQSLLSDKRTTPHFLFINKHHFGVGWRLNYYGQERIRKTYLSMFHYNDAPKFIKFREPGTVV